MDTLSQSQPIAGASPPVTDVSEMLERVARIIARAQAYSLPPMQRDCSPEEWVEAFWNVFEDVALAIMEAMREPTPGMLAAGADGLVKAGLGAEARSVLSRPRECWAAMISAAETG